MRHSPSVRLMQLHHRLLVSLCQLDAQAGPVMLIRPSASNKLGELLYGTVWQQTNPPAPSSAGAGVRLSRCFSCRCGEPVMLIIIPSAIRTDNQLCARSLSQAAPWRPFGSSDPWRLRGRVKKPPNARFSFTAQDRFLLIDSLD